jgi:uncharacterized NAD-dependent epimerase/dehydratase family protein
MKEGDDVMSSVAEASHQSQWSPPYLLYLGAATDELAIKTARGVAKWRPQWCVGQYRHPGAPLTLELADMSMAEAKAAGADTMIIGTANAGGVMGKDIAADVVAALDAGLNVASGLHQKLREHPRILEAARRNGRVLFDARDPIRDIAVGTGAKRAGKRLLTVGTDCSVGKMYTTLALESALEKRGVTVDFRATGQTGIFVAGEGIPIDSVIADFISGAAETISPARADDGWDLIEGQGSLFHPSYAGVSLGLLHGSQPDALVLCHEPARAHIRGLPDYPIPDLRACLETNLAAARLTNPAVRAVGVAVNTSKLSAEKARETCDRISAMLDLPCQDPVSMGVESIVDHLLTCFAN